MDIVKLLEENGKDLIQSDLDMLQEELNTGDYSKEYVKRGKGLIELLQAGEDLDSSLSAAQAPSASSPMEKTVMTGGPGGQLSPFNQPLPQESLAEQFERHLCAMRRSESYHQQFRNFIERDPALDETFISKHIDLFEDWELDTVVSIKPLSEEFLERHFDRLNPAKISLYQTFSEEFFIRHYSQLDIGAVLTKGPNSWRKKESRSQHLDVFLRLKGIRI